MTKGKKWTLRLLGVAALALLICLCLLGSTMARYTSSGNGSGTLTVALWELETAKVSLGETEVSKISPSNDDFSGTTPRTNPSDWIEAFTMVNNSDVAADVELDLGNGLEFTWPDSSEFTWGTGWTKFTSPDGAEGDDLNQDDTIRSGRAQTNEYGGKIMTNMGSQDAFKNIVEAFGVLDIQLGLSEAEDTEPDEAMTEDTVIKLLAKGATASDDDTKEGRITDSEVVWAQVVWTSIYELSDSDENLETLIKLVPDAYFTDATYTRQDSADDISYIDWKSFSDDVDTILGMYVTDISFAVTWTAYQASVLPAQTT